MDMLRSIGKQSGESVKSDRKKKRKAEKDLQKSKVLSLEWKSEGVMKDESGEFWICWSRVIWHLGRLW